MRIRDWSADVCSSDLWVQLSRDERQWGISPVLFLLWQLIPLLLRHLVVHLPVRVWAQVTLGVLEEVIRTHCAAANRRINHANPNVSSHSYRINRSAEQPGAGEGPVQQEPRQ